MMSENPLDDPSNILILELTYGTVAIGLGPHVAPETVDRVKTLARAGEYDNVAFHRVIDGFMAQTGDVQYGDLKDGWNPTLVGTGGSDLADIPLESSPNHFTRGIVGMARSNDPDSGNSQFFIMTDYEASLYESYTVFGLVRDGMQYVDKIKLGTGANGKVEGTPDRILDAYIVDDLAPGNAYVGDGSNDDLEGTAEKDVLFGLSGDDTLRGDKGADKLFGHSNDDELIGGKGNDRLDGGWGGDSLKGNDGRDKLYGRKGNDTLEGGRGKDTMKGGDGADTFIFSKNHNVDKIADFKNDVDTIVLDQALWGGGLTRQDVIDEFADVVDGMVVFDFGADVLKISNLDTLDDLKDDLEIA